MQIFKRYIVIIIKIIEAKKARIQVSLPPNRTNIEL